MANLGKMETYGEPMDNEIVNDKTTSKKLDGKKKKHKNGNRFIELNPVIAEQLNEHSTGPQSRIDYLVRLGLGNYDKITWYRQAIGNPRKTINELRFRDLVGEVAEKVFTLMLNDNNLYSRLRYLLQEESGRRGLDEAAFTALDEKAEKAGINPTVLLEVYVRGYENWDKETSPHLTPEQVGFNRVNAFVAGNPMVLEADSDLLVETPGAGFIGTDELVNTYKRHTPGEKMTLEKLRTVMKKEENNE